MGIAKDAWIWCLGAWLSGVSGMVGLDDLRDLFQTKLFCFYSVILSGQQKAIM